MSALTAEQLIKAVDSFLNDYSQDGRYTDAVAHLQEAQKTLRTTLPEAQDSPGRREVTAVASPVPEQTAKEPADAPAEGPKNFADASAQARERMAASR